MLINYKKTLLVVSFLAIFFNCGSNKLPIAKEGVKPNFPERKAYIVLRSEGEPTTIENLKTIISSDFKDNNVATNFSVYKARQGWDQNRIFQTAYGGKYDYIILIDQVAKFTIDKRTQVGGKYQLRSYHVKATNPDWLDLGQSTCNITVKPSIQKFSREIIRSIVGNAAVFNDHNFEYDDAIVSTSSENKVESSSSSKDLTEEIELLKLALKAEKEKTRLAELEKTRMENQLKLQLEGEREKAKLAQLDAKEASDRKKQRQKEIAESYAAKREEIRQREVEEASRNPVVVEEPKEPTRQDRIRARQETKKRLALEREEKRRQEEETAFKRQEDRKRLAEEKRQAQKRQKEALETQRREEKRLADLSRKDKQLQIEKANALAAEEERKIKAADIAEAKKIEEKRQSEALEQQRQEANRLAEQKKLDAALQAKKEDAKRLAEEKRQAQKRQKEALEVQRLEGKRLAEAKRIEDQRKADALEQERKNALRLAEQKKIDAELALQKQEAKRLAEEKTRLEEARQDELKRQQDAQIKREEREAKEASKKSSAKKPKRNTSNTSPVSGPKHAFVIIKGKETDVEQFENLKDNIEFNFMFAKVKSKIEIFKSNQSASLTNVLPRASEESNYIILIDQTEYAGEGKYVYTIKLYNKASSNQWEDVSSQTFNLSSKQALKQLSKEVTNSISN